MRTGSERKPLESVEEWVAKKEAKRRDKVLRREMKRGVVGVSNIEGLWAAGKVVEDGTREDLRGYEGIVKEGEAGDEQVLG
jgi:hypothetical protein